MKCLITALVVGTMLVSGTYAAAQTPGTPTSGFNGTVSGFGSAASGAGTAGSTGTGSRQTGATSGVTTPSLTCSRADLLDTADVTLGCQ